MVSLHKHSGSRRQSKGWEVFKPRQEGMRRGRGRRWNGTDPGGRRSVRVLSTLSVVSAVVGTQGAADRMLLRSSTFFCGQGSIASTPPSSSSFLINYSWSQCCVEGVTAVGHSFSLTSVFLVHVSLRLLC